MESNVTPSAEVRADLQRLYFHDSSFRSIALMFSNGNVRSCRLWIDYYDWEGNEQRRKQDPNAPWQWRSLEVSFGYLAHFEYSAPDLLNRPQDIDGVEFDHLLAELRASEDKLRAEYFDYRSPLFDAASGPMSLKFMTQNSSGDQDGFVLVIGSECELHWDKHAPLVGQIHIPIQDG